MSTAETGDIPRAPAQTVGNLRTLLDPSAEGESLLPFEDSGTSNLDFVERGVGSHRKAEWAMLGFDNAGQAPLVWVAQHAPVARAPVAANNPRACSGGTSRAYSSSSSGGGTSWSCSCGGSCASSTSCSCGLPPWLQLEN